MFWTDYRPTAICLLFLFTVGPLAASEDWNQWRGPRRDGSAVGVRWTNDPNDLQSVWKVRAGKGYSGPLIIGDRILVAETLDTKTAGLRALSITDGSQLWAQHWPSSGSVPFFAAANGDWIRATPVSDGELVVVGDMRETLRAFSVDTGKLVWSVDLPTRFGTAIPDFGFASSPVIEGERLFVQGANSIVALDLRSGATIWRALETDGDMQDSGAFSSPVLAEIAGRQQVLAQARNTLHGVDPATGTVLWSQDIDNFRGMMILTPSVFGDAIFTSAYRGKSHLFALESREGRLQPRELWSNKAFGYMSSPAVVDGHAYLHLANGRLDCIDLETGSSRWRTSESFGKYWSVVHARDRILALDEKGELLLLRATPEQPVILGRREVESNSWAHLAVRDDLVVVRSLEGVELLRWMAAEVAAVTRSGER